MHDGKKPDRRVARTQSLVLVAFSDLIVERGYEGFTVRDLIERADVGRSTFYEHFENKDDVFERSLSHPLRQLADGLAAPEPTADLTAIVDHFWENRALGRPIFASAARFIMERVLAELLEDRLRSRVAASCAVLPAPLIARHVAAAQIALVAAWIEADAPSCDAPALARALHASAQAAFATLHDKQTAR